MLISCQEKQDTVFSIKIDPESIELTEGETMQLECIVTPEPSSDFKVYWKSSDPEIAEVDETGKITAVSSGVTSVLAYSEGVQDAVCAVFVREKIIDEIELDAESLDLRIGEQWILKVLDGTGNEVQALWSSSDKDVAVVDDEGNVTAVSAGNAVIKATSGESTAECVVSVAEVKRGDFYYSDGTWSANLYTDKEPVGIVFWTGNPAASDGLLKFEHPECTHGLVVSLSDIGECAWQPKYYMSENTVGDWASANAADLVSPLVNTDGSEPDNLNKILGYNNTKVLELYNASEENVKCKVTPVESIKEFSNNVMAPEASSGWYLPSAKELSLLCSGELSYNIWDIASVLVDVREEIDEKIALLGENYDTIENGSYWSSCEIDRKNAVIVTCSMGNVISFQKDSPMAMVRAILAF